MVGNKLAWGSIPPTTIDDGWPDIVKTNFSDDTNNLYHNDHNGEFTDLAGPAFGPISVPFLGFGAKFFDFDNDGWKDIFIANGHVEPSGRRALVRRDLCRASISLSQRGGRQIR